MTLTDPRNEQVVDFAISPDGTQLAACVEESLTRIVIGDLKILERRLLESGFYCKFSELLRLK